MQASGSLDEADVAEQRARFDLYEKEMRRACRWRGMVSALHGACAWGAWGDAHWDGSLDEQRTRFDLHENDMRGGQWR